MPILFDFSPMHSSQFYPLQAANCDSNSRLAVDDDDNGKFRLERVKQVLNNKVFSICHLNIYQNMLYRVTSHVKEKVLYSAMFIFRYIT